PGSIFNRVNKKAVPTAALVEPALYLCVCGYRSAPCHGADNAQRFCAGNDRIRQRLVPRFKGPVLSGNQEADKRPALSSGMISDGAAQHGILLFQRIENSTQGGSAVQLQADLTVGLC